MKASIGAAAVLFALSGCATTRLDRAFDGLRRDLGPRTGAHLYWDRRGAQDREMQDRIRKALGSELSADTAVEIALVRNKSLQATYERLGIAQADLVDAGKAANPRLGAGILFPSRAGVGPSTSFSITESFLDLFLIPLRKRLASQELARETATVGSEVIDLVAQVRSGWYEAVADEQRVAMRTEVRDALQATAELIQEQDKAGNVSEYDVALEIDAYQQARLDLARAERDAFRSREQLVRLLGLWGKEIAIKLPAKLPEIPAADPPLEHLESLAIARRLDLAAARSNVALFAEASRLTKTWRYLGGLDLGVEGGNESLENSRVIGPRAEFVLPIFNQGQGAVARALSELRRAEEELEAKSVDARSEVRLERDRLTRARSSVAYGQKVMIPLRQRIVGLAQQRYNGMYLGVFELVRARQNEIDAVQEYIDASRDYWMARADLERAVGGSFDEKSETKEGTSK